jgi:hypothetical protein
VDCVRVEPANKPFGRSGGARIAPTENRSQGPTATIERKETVAEAGSTGGVEVTTAGRLVESRANELRNALGIVLACVLAPRSVGFR